MIGAPPLSFAAPPMIKSRVEQQTQQWIFEPYLKDGAR
jgi:hypothetical protein